jgi:hypothetical protein
MYAKSELQKLGIESDPQELEKLDFNKVLKEFESFLQGDGSITPSLRANWIYLQIFATYGLRLPNTKVSLLNVLGLTASNAARYTWFDAMVQAYNSLNQASHYFLDEVFVKMTDLGSSLQNYVRDGAGDDSLFGLVIELVQPGPDQDLKSALEILSDLSTTAANNVKLARDVKVALSSYHTKLTESQAKVSDVQSSVDADEKTSQDRINQLTGGKEIQGSLAQLQAKLSADQKEYHHDVVVASTTVTYAWVMIPPIPVGLMAAAPVAGVYGSKAVEMLKQVNKDQEKITEAQAELRTAVATRNTVSLAQHSIQNVQNHLSFAIEKTTQVQNSWETIANQIDFISGKIENSLKQDENEREQLKFHKLVILYMNQAKDTWTKLKPIVEKMVKDPFINVDSNEISIQDFLRQVEAEMKKKDQMLTEVGSRSARSCSKSEVQ